MVALTYDSLSNLTSETLNDRLTLSTYDGDRNRLTCAYPGGRDITTVYDPLDRLSVITDDATGQVADYKYVGPGRVTRRQLGNSTDTDYTYAQKPWTCTKVCSFI